MDKNSHAVKFTFPEKYVGHTTYRDPPYHLRHEFIEHVKQTHEPETFPGLYWGKLSGNEPFEIIHTFAVDRKKRPEGDYVPCPRCGKRDKFLEGSLVYIFSLKCIAIIGHDCASAEVKHAARRKKQRDDERRQQEDFLMSRLVDVPGMLRELKVLNSIATELERIFRDFRRGAPAIQKALRQILKVGGEYVLTEMVANEAADFDNRLPKKLVRERSFGRLGGGPLVGSSCKFLGDVRRCEQWLLSFAGCDDEEKALDATIGLVQRKEAEMAVRFISEAARTIERLRSDMSSGCSFFDEVHIKALREWARHELQPSPFDVERQVKQDGVVVVVSRKSAKSSEREYARLFLSKALCQFAEKRGSS